MVETEHRFNNKSIVYDLYRPPYPDAIIEAIHTSVKPNSVIADIGAGTGYITLPLAKNGHHVIAVEPNDELRSALEAKVARDLTLNIRSLKGKAQSTTLAEHSVDMITMGNVAHWLDKKPETHLACLREFDRILKPSGKICAAFTHPAISNSWISDVFELAKQYDPNFDIDMISASFTNPEHHALSFMQAPESQTNVTFAREMTQQDFKGFLYSLSFCDSRMSADLDKIFDRHSKGCKISVVFDSINFVGQPKKLLHTAREDTSPAIGR